jgi:hypothetical protein
MLRFHSGRGAAVGGDVGGRKALTLRPVFKRSGWRAFLTNCGILAWRLLLLMLRHPIELAAVAAYAYSLIVLGPFVTILIDAVLLTVTIGGSCSRPFHPLHRRAVYRWRHRRVQPQMAVHDETCGLVAELAMTGTRPVSAKSAPTATLTGSHRHGQRAIL